VSSRASVIFVSSGLGDDMTVIRCAHRTLRSAARASRGFVIYLANTGTMTSGPGFQVAIGEFLTTVFGRIEAWTQPVPEAILGMAVLAVAAVFVIATLHGRRHTPPADQSTPQTDTVGEPAAGDPPCHPHTTDSTTTDSTTTGMPS